MMSKFRKKNRNNNNNENKNNKKKNKNKNNNDGLNAQEQEQKRSTTKNGKKFTSTASDDDSDNELLAAAAQWANTNDDASNSAKTNNNNNKNTNKNNHTAIIPKFPSNLPRPSHGFLRNEPPYEESFRIAMNTSHLGCVWDPPSQFDEQSIQEALQIMDEYKLFRTDVTQPAGLGAKCAKTYVTRCLVGEPGTTYRYLGLRMFSHPWNDTDTSSSSNNKNKNQRLSNAIRVIANLNQSLTNRTNHHLNDLSKKRRVEGVSGFDISLINRMKLVDKLKDEPMFADSKCTVSWHADSSLQHYSTIAVYHTLIPQQQSYSNNNNDNFGNSKMKKLTLNKNQQQTNINNNNKHHDHDWSVALRVTPNAEGPKAKMLGEITVDEKCPAVAVSLESGSAYYMLDDYNHHHQHAVLAPTSSSSSSNYNSIQPTIRYSSTHRLLRHGHNVHHIIERCQTTCGNFHRKGPKRWRSEQLLLNEIETEWLRQFFIQGSEHYELLWGYWQEPIQTLFKYWQKLETRTRQVLLILKHASEAKCGINSNNNNNNNNTTLLQRQERKLRDLRKKAITTIQEILGSKSPKEILYDSMAKLLLERSKMRKLWSQREGDSVFQRMPKECRPMPFPVSYQNNNNNDKNKTTDCLAHSPMPSGSSSYLTELAAQVKIWGHCFETQNATAFPKIDLLPSHVATSFEKDPVAEICETTNDNNNNNDKKTKNIAAGNNNVEHNEEQNCKNQRENNHQSQRKKKRKKETNNNNDNGKKKKKKRRF